jgi:hypothetical protein
MSITEESLRLVKSVLATIPDQGGPKQHTAKLDSVTVGQPDSIYMLAAYCFDLTRRLQYLAKVARPLVDHIPPDIAREIIADNERINEDGISWEERARRAEEIMIRLHREAGSGWDRALREAAEREPAHT